MTVGGFSRSRKEWLRDPSRIPVAELEGIERSIAIVLRNWHWARTHGFGDLLEEHDLNPAVRIPRQASKLAWRMRSSPGRGRALPFGPAVPPSRSLGPALDPAARSRHGRVTR